MATLKEASLNTHAQRGSESNMRVQRREAFEALHRWMVSFRTIARVAFADQPTLLAKLSLNAETRRKKNVEVVVIPPTATPANVNLQAGD